MDYYVGLDVSMHSIFLCIVDKERKILREAEVPSDPQAVGMFLQGTGLKITKIGLESGNLTHWIKKGLQERDFEVVVMEARKMAAILATVINKTDTNDARGIAEALCAGHYRECVHRSDEALEIRTILHSRQSLVRERTHLISSLKGHLKVYGIKLGKGRGKDFAQKVMERISSYSMRIQRSIKSLLHVLETLDEEISQIEKDLKTMSKKDEDIQLLKSIDGIGDITALAFKAEIDDPKRFSDSKNVAAYLGLTPSQYSSGETKRQGRISKRGSKEVRYLLVEAATVLLTRSKIWSKHKAWALRLAKKKGMRKARVALARKLAVTMHSMLMNKKAFIRGTPKELKEKQAA